jgi:hypothetical protein
VVDRIRTAVMENTHGGCIVCIILLMCVCVWAFLFVSVSVSESESRVSRDEGLGSRSRRWCGFASWIVCCVSSSCIYIGIGATRPARVKARQRQRTQWGTYRIMRERQCSTIRNYRSPARSGRPVFSHTMRGHFGCIFKDTEEYTTGVWWAFYMRIMGT